MGVRGSERGARSEGRCERGEVCEGRWNVLMVVLY